MVIVDRPPGVASLYVTHALSAGNFFYTGNLCAVLSGGWPVPVREYTAST